MQDLENRITELEIRSALQDDTIDVLNKQINELYEQLALQQKQLQLLYRKFNWPESAPWKQPNSSEG